MTNSEVIKAWKGGEPGDILTFDAPFNYEGCLVGISTDGRAIYDYYKCADFYVDNNAEVEEGEELSDDVDHGMRTEWASMIDRDYRFMDRKSKFPLFLVDDDDFEDELNKIESKYDFSDCVLGRAFHFDTPVYSLNYMISSVIKEEKCTWEEAKNIVYSFTEAGEWQSDDELKYIIVDDEHEGYYFRDVKKSQLYCDYEIKESVIDKADENSECVLKFKLSDVKDFLSNIAFENYQNKSRGFLNYINFRAYNDEKDGQKKVLFEFTNGVFAAQKYTDIVIKSGVDLPKYTLSLDIVKYLSKYEGDAELKTLYRETEDKAVFYIKIDSDELAKSIPVEMAKYVEINRIIPSEVPNSVVFNKKEFMECLPEYKSKDVLELQMEDNSIKVVSPEGVLLKEIKADVKGEKINIKFTNQNLHRLCRYAPEENIILQYTDEIKAIKIAQKDIVFIVMPYKG